MPNITSQVQLQFLMNSVVAEVLDEVTEQLLRKLEDFIHQVVYNPYDPVKYDRLYFEGGLAGAWNQNVAKSFGNYVESSIEYNPSKLDIDIEQFQHGSLLSDGYTDIRESLVEIITEGKSGNLFGDGFWRQPRDFWSPFIEYFETNARPMLIKAFAEKGLKVI